MPSTATAACPRKSGAADVLEALGVKIDLEPRAARRLPARDRLSASCSRQPITRRCSMWPHVRQRARLPHDLQSAGAARQSRQGEAPTGRRLSRETGWSRLPRRWQRLAPTSAWVVHGSDGLDELTTTGVTHVADARKRRDHARCDDRARRCGSAARARWRRSKAARARKMPTAIRALFDGERGAYPRHRAAECGRGPDGGRQGEGY